VGKYKTSVNKIKRKQFQMKNVLLLNKLWIVKYCPKWEPNYRT